MASNKGYKRSWKNLLLNKRYQLEFTLFMVGISAVLMAGLGIWVMKEANDATTVAKNSIVGDVCPKIPVLTEQPGGGDDDTAVPMKLDDNGTAPAPDPAPAPAPEAAPAPAPAPAAAPHSQVDPKDVAKHNAMDDVVAVKRVWCTDIWCTPNRAEPLQIKLKNCDAYVKKKLEDPAAVEVLKKALIPVVKCEGGQSFGVADAGAPTPEHHVKVQIDESSMT